MIRAYNRYLDPNYITHTLLLKAKSKKLQFQNDGSPYEVLGCLRPVEVPRHSISYIDRYESFTYFTHEVAVKYYGEHPALISRVIVALCYYNDYGKDERFLNLVHTIRGELTETSGSLAYYHMGGYDKFEMKAGAISGITQGKLASLFIRAEKLDDAKKCLNACLLTKEEDGPYRELSEKLSWIDEYPSTVPTMVLNGHIFNLIAFAEYMAVSTDSSFDRVYNRCLSATLTYLPHYWQSGDLLYSLYHWDLSNVHYLAIMTYQMQHIYDLTGIATFKETADSLRSTCKWKLFEKTLKFE